METFTRTHMQNKRRLYKHLMIIYVFYFVALLIGFVSTIAPSFSSGWRQAQQTMDTDFTQGDVRTYYVYAPLRASGHELPAIEGLGENIEVRMDNVQLHVSVPEKYTVSNSVKVMANNGFAYLFSMLTIASYLAIFVLIALIINSLRKSIRDEQPLRHGNIGRTRAIGILMLVAALSETLIKYINIREAALLLQGTALQVDTTFPVNYWNIIVGILMLFMAEVLVVGTQLSEEQKLTI